MATSNNLKEAFAGESQANRKYLAFAKRADEEGFPQVARLFRAAGAAETVHAHAHLEVMKGVQGTAANLDAAVAGEGAEFREMYPEFIAEADAEGESGAAMSFRNAMAVEEIHHALYTDALKSVQGGNDIPEATMFVCSVCGNTVCGEAPDKCPICASPRERFFEVE